MATAVRPFPREYVTSLGCTVNEAEGLNKRTNTRWHFVKLHCEKQINFREKRK